MVVELKNIHKMLKNRLVLDNVNLVFESGNIYGVIGENGSGKTMLLRVICKLIFPDKGKVLFDDKDSIMPNVGVLIEKADFPSFYTGVELISELLDINKKTKLNEIEWLFELFGLEEYKNMEIRKYSLGMKQKIGIIQAIMENPDIIVLDEPFNALDDKSVKILYDLLLKFKNDNKIIIITSHHKEDIDELCNKIITMKNGKVIGINDK